MSRYFVKRKPLPSIKKRTALGFQVTICYIFALYLQSSHLRWNYMKQTSLLHNIVQLGVLDLERAIEKIAVLSSFFRMCFLCQFLSHVLSWELVKNLHRYLGSKIK